MPFHGQTPNGPPDGPGAGNIPHDRRGLSVKEIADKLIISAKTVEAHREHVKEKLNLKSSAELLRFVIQNSPDSR
jgi:hypothetical protein